MSQPATTKQRIRKAARAGLARVRGSLSERRLAENTHRRVLRAMDFPTGTDPYSRHVLIMGEVLMRGKKYPMFGEEPEHCAQSLLVTVELLWKARAEIKRLKANGAGQPRPAERK